MKKKGNKWIHISIEDPLKLWRKAKKYFKKPKISLQFLTYSPKTITPDFGKVLEITAAGVKWKIKNDFPKIKELPYIHICLFKRFSLLILWYTTFKDEFGHTVKDYNTFWEYLINTSVLGNSLKDVCTWYSKSQIYYRKTRGGEKPLKIPTPSVSMCLNKRGIRHIQRMLGLL